MTLFFENPAPHLTMSTLTTKQSFLSQTGCGTTELVSNVGLGVRFSNSLRS